MENNIAMADINFKNIMDALRSNGEQIEQSVIDAINAIGTGSIDPKEWISTAYNFINAVLSGYYDTLGIGLEIADGIVAATHSDDYANDYVRSINYGG